MKEWLKSVLNYSSYPINKTGYPFFGPPCRFMSFDCPLSPCKNTFLHRISFMHVQFWVSSSSFSSVSTYWVSFRLSQFSTWQGPQAAVQESPQRLQLHGADLHPRTVATDDFQEFVRRKVLVCHDWNQLITFLFPSPFNWVCFIGHSHSYHDLKVHSLAMKACFRRCGGSLSGVTNALAVATFLLKVTWRSDDNVS